MFSLKIEKDKQFFFGTIFRFEVSGSMIEYLRKQKESERRWKYFKKLRATKWKESKIDSSKREKRERNRGRKKEIGK